ncbi:hypothetical protein CDIK_3236 [Cucumispora dikerogammari]|nr:hypothetical protein CDIK_3236 [Cucumispora dikerogammari]
MLALVSGLSIISCDKEYEEKWLDVKITSCVDENGKIAELPKTTNFCTYKLNLCQEKTRCILTVELKIKSTLNIYIYGYSVRLVKCTENMESGNIENDYADKLIRDNQICGFDAHHDERSDRNFIFCETRVVFDNCEHLRESQKDYLFPNGFQGKVDGRYKKDTISQFRKLLDIEGDKIKTTMFKFILHLSFWDRTSNKECRKMIVESLPFGFNENVEGTLVLEKAVNLDTV